MLPPVLVGWGKTDPDPRFPSGLPNTSFLIDPYVPSSQKTPDPVHRYYQHILQINRGKMDRYVAWTDTGGLHGPWMHMAPLQRDEYVVPSRLKSLACLF